MQIAAHRRFKEHTPAGAPHVLRAGSGPAAEARTRYPAKVVDPARADRVLKGGVNNRKIGSHVVKGRWRGLPVFTLTLEERKTCWSGCRHWLSCYGNKMHFSPRHAHGPTLVAAVERDLDGLLARHPAGIVVRLHVLGDFYSVGYVRAWAGWLRRFPTLRVYGYTGWPPSGDIGRAVHEMVEEFGWGRCAVRFSNHCTPTRGAVSVADPGLRGRIPEGIVCPVQSGDAECCGSCTLCWATEENVAFIDH